LIALRRAYRAAIVNERLAQAISSRLLSHAARYAQEHGVFTVTSVTVYEIVYGLVS
jgi:6,7-dimethyl-8-ribityllumazine synthase